MKRNEVIQMFKDVYAEYVDVFEFSDFILFVLPSGFEETEEGETVDKYQIMEVYFTISDEYDSLRTERHAQAGCYDETLETYTYEEAIAFVERLKAK